MLYLNQEWIKILYTVCEILKTSLALMKTLMQVHVNNLKIRKI